MPRLGLPCAAQMRGLRRRLEGKQLCSPGCQAGCAVLSVSLVDVDADCQVRRAAEVGAALPADPFLLFLDELCAFMVDKHVHRILLAVKIGFCLSRCCLLGIVRASSDLVS